MMKMRSGIGMYGIGALICIGGLVVAPHGVRDRNLVARHMPAAAPDASKALAVVPVAELIGLALFRSTRRAPELTYLEARSRENISDVDREEEVARPAWQLTGIVWAETPIALFDGVAGEDRTRLVAVGDRIGEIQVVRIDSTEVTLSHADSTWTYRIAVPWK